MSTLRVVLDQVGSAQPSGIGRYALELTRALIETAPRGVGVSGIVASSPDEEYRRIAQELPGLASLHKSSLDRRQLAAAWQHGFTRLPGNGMVHAPSLLAPLYNHDRLNNPGEQFVVTVHEATPWTHPETLAPRAVAWHKAMARRAQRYADAVVVPTHAVAEELAEAVDFGERIRVIAGAVSSELTVPHDVDARAQALGLPERYVLAVGPLEKRKGIPDLLWAMGDVHAPDVPLVLVGVGDVDIEQLEHQAHLDAGRVIALGTLPDADLAVAYARASVVVVPSISEGFGLPALEAMGLGAPVVHSDAPALLEVCADAGLIVPRLDAAGYPRRLADAIQSVLDDDALATQLSVRGRDRARAYNWRDSAEKTWQLHADL
ncbi:glycosyltransferase family 1 protein [Chryseoglobus sp. 28M-23]|uniref:glycosyltransferase family 4 protein n=1 Tax=Chryseoglobus sp. 28M-23 TaxID=2772253 RepID=UPI001746E6CE|nr:glycosyltransferase family 1 protein [Chryseoglobus sp. 28M-23]QOD93258.1 glycosyltransferase family 4 protein [Chryseoglobus sp. 28M-23]